ncbi:MAG TPA: SCO family protein, partial [Longimicrobiaceae bacterium]|nr:SCO family protein [Longimicrobiaceae bacterium]
DWVVRARVACFGTTGQGLPDTGGWLMLTGAPFSMMIALVVITHDDLLHGLKRLWRSRAGRFVLAAFVALILLAGHLAGVRVTALYGLGEDPGAAALAAGSNDGLVALNQPAPRLELPAHAGAVVRLTDLQGRPVILTFAYGKCETICPLVVHDAMQARAATRDRGTVLLVVTLDPWRDSPTRLPHIASSWGLGEDAHLLGGSVDEVNAALDAWKVERVRDPRTGEIGHTGFHYVIGRDGHIGYLVAGGADRVAEAVRRVDSAHAAAANMDVHDPG